MSLGVSQLKAELMLHLSRERRLDGVKLQSEFPGQRAAPLKSPVVVVGLAGVEVQPGGFGGYLGEQTADLSSLYGKIATVTVFFEIHCPPGQGGEACHQIYEALCDSLMLEQNGFGFVHMRCEGIHCDQTSYSNRLRVQASLKTAVALRDTGLTLSGFEVLAVSAPWGGGEVSPTEP